MVRVLLASTVTLLAVTGCGTVRSLEQLDDRVHEVVRRAAEQEFGEVPPERAALNVYRTFESPGEEAVKLDLRSALLLAARHSRDYQSDRETLYRSALSLLKTSHSWDTNVSNALSSVLGRNLDVPETSLTGDASIGLSQRFLSGATLTTRLAFDSIRYIAGDRRVNLSTLASASLVQPLLSGRGPEVARESLTQAERNLIYALRSFVRQRKGLLIDVADAYYNVLSAQDGLEIARQNLANLTLSRERSEALAEAGTVPQFQVDQARQRELSANASVVSRQESFQAAKDSLKRVLGLPLEARIEVDRAELKKLADAKLPDPPMTLDESRDHALAHRLDHATVRDRLEDTQRATRIAADDLRARLDLTLAANASSPTDDHLRAIVWDEGYLSAGVNAELPFDKTDEYIDYKNALISEERQKRQVAKDRDDITAGLRNVWRRLASSRKDIDIQRLSVKLAEKRVDNTKMLFEFGRINIREQLDARDDLINARNRYTEVIVEYRMNWLSLLYQLELLPTEPDTLWSPALAAGTEPATP
ncbi:MAG: TolC family protein [Victivallales bacterium]|nr:TolC family protein [Victivallales bacterium]